MPGGATTDATRRFNAPPELIGQTATDGFDPPPLTPGPEALIQRESGEPEISDEISMDEPLDMDATAVGPMPEEVRVDMDVDVEDAGEPAPGAVGSVYTSLPADGTLLQVKAMIRQRLVDDELVWVFIDKGLVTEAEVTWLRGAPLPPRGGPR